MSFGGGALRNRTRFVRPDYGMLIIGMNIVTNSLIWNHERHEAAGFQTDCWLR